MHIRNGVTNMRPTSWTIFGGQRQDVRIHMTPKTKSRPVLMSCTLYHSTNPSPCPPLSPECSSHPLISRSIPSCGLNPWQYSLSILCSRNSPANTCASQLLCNMEYFQQKIWTRGNRHVLVQVLLELPAIHDFPSWNR